MHQIAGLAAEKAAEKEPTGWPSGAPLLPHPAEMIIGVIAFAILYWVYKTKVVPKMEQMYAERTEAIEGGMHKAERAQAEAEEAKRRYEAQLADARTEANSIREEARADAAQILAEAREQATTESTRITENAQRTIEAERQQAQTSLRADLGRQATELASRIVGESLHDETRQRGIVDRFLGELESGKVTPEKVGTHRPGAGS